MSAREKEGYSLADIELVIRYQCSLWGKDEKMRKYLHPETLSSSKFEAYLSDAQRSEPQQNDSKKHSFPAIGGLCFLHI